MNKHMQVPVPKFPSAQRGAVLFVGLVFLVLLTLIAVTATNTSIMQERMTGGLRNAQLAMSGAESAMREAETRLWNASVGSSPFSDCGTEGLFGCYSYVPEKFVIPAVRAFRESRVWTDTGATIYSTKDLTAMTGLQATGNLSRNPAYIIEDLGLDLPPGASGYEQKGLDPYQTDKNAGIKHLYRTTARSTGGNDGVIRVVESTFAAKSN
ncbi:MAG: PilX N-terminal domain-containing pilus assembly protein [Tahibacter sp.]